MYNIMKKRRTEKKSVCGGTSDDFDLFRARATQPLRGHAHGKMRKTKWLFCPCLSFVRRQMNRRTDGQTKQYVINYMFINKCDMGNERTNRVHGFEYYIRTSKII